MADSLIKWYPSYSVGNEDVDSQHKKIFEIINDLYAHITSGKNEDITPQLIEELKRYTLYHFTLEESLMRKSNYPQLQMHVRAHNQLKSEVESYGEEVLSGKPVNVLKLLNFLKNWLQNHILIMDKDFGPFIK